MNGTTWLMWLGVGLAMAAVEAATVDFVFIMLAIGALAGAVASFLGAGFVVSAVIAVAVALALLVTLRPALVRRLSSRRDNSDIGAGAVVGSRGSVLHPVGVADGLVKVDGEIWTARSTHTEPIPAGATVEIRELRGATLLVEPVASPYPLPGVAD